MVAADARIYGELCGGVGSQLAGIHACTHLTACCRAFCCGNSVVKLHRLLAVVIRLALRLPLLTFQPAPALPLPCPASSERAAIEDWIYREGNNTSPLTNQPLAHKMLMPCDAMRHCVAEVGAGLLHQS